MEFVTYRKFVEEDDVQALADILDENAIRYEISQDRESLDALYLGSKPFKSQFFVKLKKEDFKTVDTILAGRFKQQLGNVDKEHYLFSFSDDELYELISKPDEWSDLDYQLALDILRQRGKEVDEKTIERLKQERLAVLAKPEDKHRVWIVIGYFSALIGGLLGILVGWHVNSFKKTLPNGERVYAFNDSDRAHGLIILILGVIMFTASVLIRIWQTNLF